MLTNALQQTPTTTTSRSKLTSPSRGRTSTRGSGRRRRGSGGVTVVRDGVWRVDVEISRDPITGQRRRISRQVRGTRADAEVALAKLRVADHDQRRPRPGTRARTIRAALDEYVADVETGVIELAPKTVVTTRSARNTMCSIVLPDGRVFGDIRLASLGWQDVEAMFRAMRTGRSVEWVRRAGTVLSRGLDRARKHGLIDHNPAKDATRPKVVRRKPHAPSKEDVAALIAQMAARDKEMADGALIVATTGMRMGELLGLQWSNVELDGAVVHEAWAVTDGGPGVGVIRKLTKRCDWRDVPLTSAAVAAFRRQQHRCADTFGLPAAPAFYAFSSRYGPEAPHRPDTFGDRFAAARGDHSITFLHLRHFTATAMLDAGEDYRTVPDILGNSETTLRLHYDGRTNLDKRRVISALNF
ncbi:tyrosine-type recombinase/integrase [soil metagenome]